MYVTGESVCPMNENSIGDEQTTLAGNKYPHNNHKANEEAINKMKFCFESAESIIVLNLSDTLVFL